MSEFKDVTAVKKANVYFDGKVSSRVIIFPNGERKTLGLMLPGEYTFSTREEEIMEMLAGSMDVKLPGSNEFVTYKEGQKFNVPSDSSFDLKVNEVVDYCCSYIAD
ncbi:MULTISPECIES: pyrimidine/purine nucleoside phosphorylase [unclassified Clostridioides]|uniref:pyrimidine/purine nucleoside phosphorylase n=1 Tax=unclassified Clostridioides TaxID=2635829 RepID=UPI001D0C1BC6|nr:pyrimidine/purine nucleoside phosphorylase [Clostridioides sp. ES-S-0049-03]MCC0650753.1 pyrimidine/purine nucleoside phosphorylase [Clostridioides sp. ZZV15-6598]MCC0652182.1 pyrimidine/purine nucleoside phosphorylase [Clostridioides sp. ES-S-0001-03]MCC0655481.1 pyrimidine/purine nucleoside phosphorylase [Clostridioides sp. ES-S-0123-01]MCC0670677.1 pyrimidine/purine nucleoside phosphorylase [Clostridioides sp. ES-S-0145-01]MCC0674735.1 pyrimidine/purine nucleoside phosphorylase [Clostrid